MTKEQWVPLADYVKNTADTEEAKYEAKVERDKMTRRHSMITSAVGRGGPADYNVAISNLVTKRRGIKPNEWDKLLAACVATPNEWFNRRSYYNDRAARNSQSQFARVLNAQGTNSKVDKLAAKVRGIISEHGGKFEASATYNTETTDDPSKGNYMHLLFLRWAPGLDTSSNGSSS